MGWLDITGGVINMSDRDSVVFMRLVRLCKKHIQWVGLSDAAHDILALLLVEKYWSKEPMAPEDIETATGYSRGTISVVFSQLRGLGFIDGILDTDQKGRGRKRTKYAISGGLSGLIAFGVKKLDVELGSLVEELQALMEIIDESTSAEDTIIALDEEAQRNIAHLKDATMRILASKARADSFEDEAMKFLEDS